MTEKNEDKSQTALPSLLERQSRGGDIAEGGISFQGEVVLSMIPKWLRLEGFTSMVRENMGDAEAKFFVPGKGYRKEFIEVKDHQIQPAEFWQEIERFKEMHHGTGDEYQWFTLASAGLSQSLHPLVNSLRRIKNSYDFYKDSQIEQNTYNEYLQVVRDLEKPDEDGDFLFKKVLILNDLSLARDSGKILFKQSLIDNLPYYQDLPNRVLDNIYSEMATFVSRKRTQTITRNELEAVLRSRLLQKSLPELSPIHVHTAINEIETDSDSTALRFEWADFFAGEERNYPPPEVWNERLIGELIETKKWILENHSTRRIYLTGNRRLSTSLAIGSIFSAVAGFSIEMQQREQVYATNAHAAEQTPDYEIQSELRGKAQGERLVVSIGIIRDVVPEVEEYLQKQRLSEMPGLHIKGLAAITSPEQANLVTGKIKRLISDNVVRIGARQIDLFIAAPAFLALFLGHRLNATAPVQCYERVAAGQYEPTCLLFSK